jgi:hypothetical protein
MTIPFDKLKARLLANPKVKTEYDVLALDFETSAESYPSGRIRTRPGSMTEK